MMRHISNLAERNTETVATVLSDQYAQDSRNDTVSTDMFYQANEHLAMYLYGTEVADLVRRGAVQRLDTIHRDVTESVSASSELLEEVALDRIGLIVVRPELLGLADDCIHMLEQAGLQLIFDETTRIDFRQYWSLYGAGLRDPESRLDFPTRTLNYISHDIRLLVVCADPSSLPEETVSDYITKELKGRQGSYTAGTLRGELAYLALRDLIAVDGQSFIDGTASMALDPIGAYRQLVRGNVESDRMHSTANIPLLFYAGQAIHVPTSTELGRDLRVLCNDEALGLIAERIV